MSRIQPKMDRHTDGRDRFYTLACWRGREKYCYYRKRRPVMYCKGMKYFRFLAVKWNSPVLIRTWAGGLWFQLGWCNRFPSLYVIRIASRRWANPYFKSCCYVNVHFDRTFVLIRGWRLMILAAAQRKSRKKKFSRPFSGKSSSGGGGK